MTIIIIHCVDLLVCVCVYVISSCRMQILIKDRDELNAFVQQPFSFSFWCRTKIHLVTANVIHGGAQVVVFTGKLGAIFLRSISADVSNQQHLRYVFQFFKKINQENQSTPEFEPN